VATLIFLIKKRKEKKFYNGLEMRIEIRMKKLFVIRPFYISNADYSILK
jgi:hypothetical protein